MVRRVICIVGILVFGLLLDFMHTALAAEEAGKPEDFYKGKTIKLISAASAGTGVDLFARTTAPFLKEYTGAKAVIVDNKAAGSGLEGMNAVRLAKADGLTLGIWQVLSALMNELMDAPGWEQIKVEENMFIMGGPIEPHLFSVSPGGPYQTVSQLQAAKNLKIAGHGPGSNMTMVGCTVADLFDLDAKVIVGIAGVANVAKSVMQGETQGTAMPLSTAVMFANQGLLKPLFVMSSKRYPPQPNIPAVTEFIKQLTPKKEALVELWGEKLILSNGIWTTPGTPKERVDYLRKISREIVSNPEYQKEVKKLYLFDLTEKDFPAGEEIEGKVKRAVKEKKQIQEVLKGLLEKYCK